MNSRLLHYLLLVALAVQFPLLHVRHSRAVQRGGDAPPAYLVESTEAEKDCFELSCADAAELNPLNGSLRADCCLRLTIEAEGLLACSRGVPNFSRGPPA